MYKRESISRMCDTCDFKSLRQYTKSLKIILSPSGINKPRTVHSHSVKKGVWWWWWWWGGLMQYVCLFEHPSSSSSPSSLYFSLYISLSLILCSIKLEERPNKPEPETMCCWILMLPKLSLLVQSQTRRMRQTDRHGQHRQRSGKTKRVRGKKQWERAKKERKKKGKRKERRKDSRRYSK